MLQSEGNIDTDGSCDRNCRQDDREVWTATTIKLPSKLLTERKAIVPYQYATCAVFVFIALAMTIQNLSPPSSSYDTNTSAIQSSIADYSASSSHYFPHIDVPSGFNFAYSTSPRRRLDDNQHHSTGSFANCKPTMKTSRSSDASFTLTHNVIDPVTNKTNTIRHPESALTVISCRSIHYRAPLMEIEKGGHKIVIGVLSGAGGKGPLHRDSIRSTWARERMNMNDLSSVGQASVSGSGSGVYFIVAGPWEDIKQEYDRYRDLIWIEEDEVYEGEESVLPFKTEAFIHVVHKYALPGKAGFEYLFKTDDDSFVDINKLEKTIAGKKYNYWGCCTTENFKPLRSPTRKWRVTFDLYPEEFYPLYCQGAGFAMSRDFVECMSNHLADFRYNPFEDVSIGLLAERCGIMPESDFDKIKQYRTEEAGEKKQLVNDGGRKEIFFLPKATMKNKVLQHRVKTHYDMYAHYMCVQESC